MTTRSLAATALLIMTALGSSTGKCDEVKPVRVKLPFPAGSRYSVNQGNFGKFSHNDKPSAYAWDFNLPEGSIVTAAAAGRIVDFKQDGKAGGPSLAFAPTNNYVIIDHGGGHFSKYMHLQHESVKVKVGDIVRAGQAIALSGSTGFATSAHLHFQVNDCNGNSIPCAFVDYPYRGGIPLEGDSCKSGAITEEVDRFTDDTPLSASAFSDNGIELTSTLPSCVFEEGHTYQVKGKTSRPNANVHLFLMPKCSFETVNEFDATTTRDGSFDCAMKLKMPLDESRSCRLTIVVAEANGFFKSHVNVPVYITPEPEKASTNQWPVVLMQSLRSER